MSRIKELRETPMPLRIAELPRDERGYPIPFFVAVRDGKPDLAFLDQRKQLRCIQERRCGICGGRIPGVIAFISGPLGIENRVVTDPGMHEVCARYALAVCPYLVRPNARRAARTEPFAEDYQISERPERSALYLTTTYRPFSPDGKNVLVSLGPPRRIVWFENGKEVPA